MKSLLITPLVIFALLASLHAGADFAKGIATAQAGDDATAFQEFKKAAKQGHAKAQYKLGLMYDNGRGVLQDYKQAVKWYRLAAEKGIAKAQANLGLMYHNGRGVLHDSVYAHMWWNIAASEGHENAKKARDTIVQEMTQTQIAEAIRLARECVAKEYKGC